MNRLDIQLGRPSILYQDTEANIEALSGPVQGMVVLSTDTNKIGTYNGASWDWAGAVDLSDAVILAPASSSRNVIQPTDNYIPLILKGHATQTAHIFETQSSAGAVTFYVGPYGGAYFNVQQSANGDVNISSQHLTPMLFVDASTDRLGLGTSSPQKMLHIYGGHIVFENVQDATACTAALAGAGAGNVDNGDHYYKITYVTPSGETGVTAATASNKVTTVDKSTDGKVSLTNIPISADGRVTARKIYRTKIANSFQFFLLGTIADNSTTTYTDNTADAGLGADNYQSKGNTTTGTFYSRTYGGTSYPFMTVTGNVVVIGTQAAYNAVAFSQSIAIGYQALYNVTTASFNNAVGYQSLYSITTGNQNTAFGHNAGYTNDSNYNCYFGHAAGGLHTGTQSIFIGRAAGNNSGKGVAAGNYNVVIGHGAAIGNAAYTLHNSVIIGRDAGGYSMTGTVTGVVIIGYQAGYYNTASNVLIISNNATTTPLISGLFSGAGAGVIIYSQHVSGVPLTIQGITSQAYNLQEWKSVAGVVASIDPNGAAYFAGRISVVQSDGNEHIDSYNDGYLDLNATQAIRLNQDTAIVGNSDLWFEDAGSGMLAGSCYGNDIGFSQASAVQNTWYAVSDSDISDGEILNTVSHDGNGALTVSRAGKYVAWYSLSVEDSANNDHIETGIDVEGSVVGPVEHFVTKVANDENAISGVVPLDLSASDVVQVAIRTTDNNTPTIGVDHISLFLMQIGA